MLHLILWCPILPSLSCHVIFYSAPTLSNILSLLSNRECTWQSSLPKKTKLKRYTQRNRTPGISKARQASNMPHHTIHWYPNPILETPFNSFKKSFPGFIFFSFSFRLSTFVFRFPGHIRHGWWSIISRVRKRWSRSAAHG